MPDGFMGSLGQLVEEGLRAAVLLAVDDGERFGHGLVALGGLDAGAVGPDRRPDDQIGRRRIAGMLLLLYLASRSAHHLVPRSLIWSGGLLAGREEPRSCRL
jgi:hypothetical protein